MEENKFTPNFKNSVHQQKKASNKCIKFVIYQKSVSTGQNEGFPEKCNFTGPKSYFHSNQCLKKKKKENGFFQQKQNFKKLWPPSNCNNGFQKECE